MRKDYTFSVRVPAALLPRIDAVLKGGEIRTMFARTAIEAEIERRELGHDISRLAKSEPRAAQQG